MGKQRGQALSIKEIDEGRLVFELEVRTNQDTIVARQRTKQIARLLGLRGRALTQIATSALEIVRNALDHCRGARVFFHVGQHSTSPMLWITVQVAGALPEEMPEQGGISIARRLVDLFSISSEPGQGMTIVLGKQLRGNVLGEPELLAVADAVARSKPRSTLKEAQEQNRELMEALSELRRTKRLVTVRAQAWQATFDAIPDALCLLDKATAVLQINHAMAAFLDCLEAEVIGRPWREASPFARSGDPIDAVFEQARQSRCRATEERKLYNRWYRLQIDVLLDEQGRTHRFVLLVADITVEKRTAERLEQINEALKTYAHSVSHDIKGPLAGAITANQVLQQLLDQPITDKTRTSVRELGQVLSTSIKKALTLLDEVLALAETGAGPGGATDVGRVIRHVLEDRQDTLEAKGVEVKLGSELGQAMVAPVHLYQIFANLLDNAVKHASRPALTIWIDRRETCEEGVHCFAFRDDGPGIPDGLENRIFEPFVRADSTGGGEGQGIGLATVKRIVGTYNGEVRAHNDGGACFELELRDAVS